MGKEKQGFLTPKAIANRIKAKGLQKLRWYCQMCEKQCRDENGFKCHCMSESHQRQMQMFSENSGTYMDGFSKEFEEGMMEIISRKAKNQRASAAINALTPGQMPQLTTHGTPASAALWLSALALRASVNSSQTSQ